MRYWLKQKLFAFMIQLMGRFSLLLVVIISVDRVIMVYHPLWSKIHSTPKRALQIILTTLLIYTIYHLHFLYGFDGVTVKGNGNSTYTQSKIQIVDEFVSEQYVAFLFQFHFKYFVPIHDFLLSLIILAANIVVIVKLVSRVRQKTEKLGLEDKTDDTTVKISVMLVVVGLITAAFRLPVVIMGAISSNTNFHLGIKTYYDVILNYVTMQVLFGVGYFNSCINFFIYLTMSINFRQQLCQMIGCYRKRNARSNDMTMTSGLSRNRQDSYAV